VDELVDILDENGHYTGETAHKSKAHELGLFHPTIHVWCYSKSGMVLLQQRAANKEANPLKWDVSVAGHIGAGERPEIGALREAKEEIGVSIQLENLEKIAVYKKERRYSPSFFDREYTHTYLYVLDENTPLIKQESEVADLKWVSLENFKTMVLEDSSQLVPNSGSHYQKIIELILTRL